MLKKVLILKKMIGNITSATVLFVGLFRYLFLKRNSEKEYQALIRCFCWSRGLSNDLISRFISLKEILKSKEISNSSQEIVKSIRKNGFHVIEEGIPGLPLDQLINLTETLECDAPGKQEIGKKIIYNEAINEQLPTVTHTRMDYREEDLVKLEFVQGIVNNSFFLEIAKGYLGVSPKVDIVTMWWTLANKKKDLAGDAQMYHFDMDRVKWLKVFIYLTDVSDCNGPHTFIKGSHQSFAIPHIFLKNGYQRITDEDIFSYYSKSEIISFPGKKGSIIFEDTRGLHKGAPIVSGARLVFQIEYVNTLFGAPANKKTPGFINYFSNNIFTAFEGN